MGHNDIGQVTANVAQIAHAEMLDVGVAVGRIGRVVAEREANALRSAIGRRRVDRRAGVGHADKPRVDLFNTIPPRQPVADSNLLTILPAGTFDHRWWVQVWNVHEDPPDASRHC